MADIHTTVDIDAPAETVWQVLVDFERYPEWNDWLHVDGRATVGDRLRVTPGPAGSGPSFRPRVLEAAPNRTLRWLGHLFVPGLFDGEHRFDIEDLGEDRSRLVQSEAFDGLLVGPVLWRYGEQTERSFEGVNEALRTRAEALTREEGATVEGDPVDETGA
jgi:hypothetical protein